MAESTTSTPQSPPSVDALYEAATELQIFAFREESLEERKRLEHLCFRAGVELGRAGCRSLQLLLDDDSIRTLPGGLLRGLCSVGEAKAPPASVVPGGPSSLDGVAARAESPFSTASCTPAHDVLSPVVNPVLLAEAAAVGAERASLLGSDTRAAAPTTDDPPQGDRPGVPVPRDAPLDVDIGRGDRERDERVERLRRYIRRVYDEIFPPGVPPGGDQASSAFPRGRPAIYEPEGPVADVAVQTVLELGNAALALETVATRAEDPAATRAVRCVVAGLQATRAHLLAALKKAGLVAGAVTLLLAAPARAEEWKAPDALDVGSLAVAEALLACDGLQTIQMTNHYNEGWSESDPLLGDKPSRPRIAVTFGAALLVDAAVWYFLPQDLRRVFSGVVIGVEGVQVYRNAQGGLGPFSSFSTSRAPSLSLGFRVRL